MDRRITDLTAASQISSPDLFVLEQGGEAKKLTGEALKQYIENVPVNGIDRAFFDDAGRCHVILENGDEIISQTLHGEDAPTVTSVALDTDNHLIFTFSDGSTLDAGLMPGSGDMSQDNYDADGDVKDAGGISDYVAGYIAENTVTSINGETGDVDIATLPEVSRSDNGKFLRVVNGAWRAAALETYDGEVL